MKIHEYFMQGLQLGLHMKRHWMNSLFTLVYNFNDYREHYDYRLYQDEMGLYFEVPGERDERVYLEDYVPGRAPLHFRDAAILKPGELENFKGPETITTTYGNIYVNHLVLCQPFGDIFPYQNGQFDLGAVEKRILDIMIDDREDGDTTERAPDGKIYVWQYLMFAEHILTVPAFSDHLVTAVTEKSLVAAPGRDELRAEWEKKNAHRLTDPVAIAELGVLYKELDDAWLAGDESNDFYGSKKKLEGARKKVHYMFGGESGFSDGTKVEYIGKSLEEGLDMEKLPAMFNSIRYGSYNRGSQTALGGESTKTIYRMVGTVRIVEDDCKTHIGVPTYVGDFNAKDLIGYTMVERGVNTLLTPEVIKSNMYKIIDVRGPMSCKSGRDVDKGILGKGKNICAVCAGTALAENPNGIPAAAAGVGGRFLSLFMAKMHSTVLRTVPWNMATRLT